MTIVQAFQADWEFDVARADNVLNLELGEFGVKAQFLDDTSIFAGSEARVVFRFGASDDHFSRGENEGRRFRFTNTHDHSSKSLFISKDVSIGKPFIVASDKGLTFGLYSALRACIAIVFKSRRVPRLTVATIFLSRCKAHFQLLYLRYLLEGGHDAFYSSNILLF